MRKGECGLRNKTPPWPENPEFFIPHCEFRNLHFALLFNRNWLRQE
jgi:hypothetical protein